MRKQIVVFALNYRNYQNIAPLLCELAHKEWEIKFVLTPNKNDPSIKSLSGLPYPILASYSVDPRRYSSAQLKQIVRENSSDLKQARLVFLPDVQNFPASCLYWHLKCLNRKLKIVGFQHGLSQVWVKNFLSPICDIYLAFGKKSLNFFPKYRKSDLVEFGLPRLNSEKLITQNEERYILFVGQKAYDQKTMQEFLEAVSKAYALRVLVRNHPQYPNRYRVDAPFRYDPKTDELVQQIASAAFVLTSYSTCVLDVIRAKKKVVLFAQNKDALFDDFPFKIKELILQDLQTALNTFNQQSVENWSKETIVNLHENNLTQQVAIIESFAGLLHPGYEKFYRRGKSLIWTCFKNVLRKLKSYIL